MNNRTRKQIAEMRIQLKAMQKELSAMNEQFEQFKSKVESYREKLEEYQSDIDTWACEEREKFDNLPESLQYSERGEAFEACADALEDANSEAEELLELMSEFSTKLDELPDFEEIADGIENIISPLSDIE